MKQSRRLCAALGLVLTIITIVGHADEQAIRKMFQAKLPDA
jgi:hypothetical protein